MPHSNGGFSAGFSVGSSVGWFSYKPMIVNEICSSAGWQWFFRLACAREEEMPMRKISSGENFDCRFSLLWKIVYICTQNRFSNNRKQK